MYKIILKLLIIGSILFSSIVINPSLTSNSVQAATQCVDPDGPAGPKPDCCVTCLNSQCTRIYNADTCTKACLAPNVCSNGSTTCGSCPVSGGSCTPGQWGGCGSNGCGSGQTSQCNGSGTGWNCFNDPTACSGGGSSGGGGCTASNPGLATQQTPANDAIMPLNDVTVTFTNSTGWGVKCPAPNVNRFRIIYRLNNPATGELGAWVTGTALSSVQPYAINDLQWGKRYEWRVRKTNGQGTRDTASRFFTINATSTLVSNGLTSLDVCGVRISGRTEFAGVTNPISYSVGFQDAESNPFEEIWLAFVPTTGVNGQNTQFADDSVLHSKIINSKAFAVKYSLLNNSASILGNAGTWINENTSGDISSPDNGVSILNIGTNTVGSITGNQANATFQIRFNNNFPTNNYSIYALAINDNGTNQFASSYAQVGDANNITYLKVDEWGVDMVPPTADVSTPLFTSSTEFGVNWSASDSFSGLGNIQSFIKSDIAGSSLFDQLIGNTFNFVAADLELPAGITQPLLVNHNYVDLQTASSATYSFRLNITDRACNTAEDTSEAAPTVPWLMGLNSNLSGLGGIKNIEIPEQERVSIPEINYNDIPTLSTDGVISGTLDIPQNNISSVDKYVLGYNNFATKPPITSDYDNWYDHLFNKVNKNTDSNIIDSAVTTANTTMSSTFGVAANSKNFYQVSNLTLQSDLICDIQAIIFIEGNLTIRPNLTNSNQLNGCIFVVQGDITVEAGTRKTFEALDSTDPAGYDLISGVFITNSNLIIPSDQFDNDEKWDGLIINGTALAQGVSLGRDLNLTANATQPAHIFNYDAKYLIMFAKELADRSYSLREGLN
jgi:hypothetical protein